VTSRRDRGGSQVKQGCRQLEVLEISMLSGFQNITHSPTSWQCGQKSIPIGIACQSQGNSSDFSGNPTQYQGDQYLGRNWQFSAALRPTSESFPMGCRGRLACSDWLKIYGLRSSIRCLFRYPLLQHHDYPTIHSCCRWLSVAVYTIYHSF
jgi:hypothetical protein